MRTEARFPGLGPENAHYESFYIKATRPGGGQGVWIRHTVHKPPGAEPTASLWLTLFDADAAGPVAVKATFDAAELSAPDGAYVRIDSAELRPGRATGAIALPDLEASWELEFTDPGEALFHLPYRRMYGAPLPKTKLLSPYPSARFNGTLTVGSERIELHAWPGMIGHNWGSEHAERWVWIQAPEVDGAEDSYVDIAAGRIKLGPVTTPWIANGMIRIDGRDHRLGGLARVLSTKVRERSTSCEFELGGDGVKLRGEVSSEPRNFVAWIYADPKGGEHHTLNCSISDLELEVERGGESERLAVSGAAAYEFGSHDTDHGIPLQPYTDG